MLGSTAFMTAMKGVMLATCLLMTVTANDNHDKTSDRGSHFMQA